ncbi:MAG: helix-turn-helix transcriptional regulator [Synechococcaceae cyanobacterium RM1_1_27]|nr:helix-turn-helix transcriptional regulator [Synechococcaceae cyanobacterium SM2_3_2]NJO86113.1 helix-turn-helix transcriptional regulator [Synechococcaceae cyanobacterium RM1_1_27]
MFSNRAVTVVAEPPLDQSVSSAFLESGVDSSRINIPPAALARIADYFKVLSEVSRLQILCTLKSGPKNVSQIIDLTEMGQANVSKHLKLLTQAGMVGRHPQGVSVYYQISDPTLFRLCDLVCEQLSIQLQERTEELQQLAPLKEG